MQVKVYVIEVKLPKWAWKLAAYVMPLALVLVLRSDVDATPTRFTSGATLTATALQSLNIAIHGTSQYSVGATAFCGTAPTPTGGNLGGYTGGKSMCETACTSPSAHMCSSEEVLRSVQLGYTLPPNVFYSTALSPFMSGGTQINDCNGWLSSSPGNSAAAWGATAAFLATCDRTVGILCCD